MNNNLQQASKILDTRAIDIQTFQWIVAANTKAVLSLNGWSEEREDLPLNLSSSDSLHKYLLHWDWVSNRDINTPGMETD